MKLFDDSGDRVFSTLLDNLASFEFIWVDVADELAQSFEVLAPRYRLVVVFDKRYGHKTRIIQTGLQDLQDCVSC